MPAIQDRTQAIKRLHSLRFAVGQPTQRGFKSRVEFLQLAYRFDLIEAITSYRLWDEGYIDLGERTFDTCFEMGDSAEVIAGLIADARSGGYLESIRTKVNDPVQFARWCGYADRQPALAL